MKEKVSASPLKQVVNLSKECNTLVLLKKEGERYIHLINLARSTFPTSVKVKETQETADYHLEELKAQIKSRLEPILMSKKLDYDKVFPKGFLSVTDLLNGYIDFPVSDDSSEALILAGDKEGTFITINEDYSSLNGLSSLISNDEPLYKYYAQMRKIG